MIWQSTAIMTIIDIIIIGMACLAYRNFHKHKQTLKRLHLTQGVSLCLAGLVLLALFYLADLAAMHILPYFIPMAQAMELMTSLHLNFAWIVAVLVAGLIVAGLIYLLNTLFPKLDELLEELKNHRDRLEEQVAERTEELRAANKELESYSYSIAHDLRAPLRSITGFSQIIQEDAGHKLSAEEKEHFERIISASKHMAELIDDILELSRVTRSRLQHTEVNLTALAEATMKQLCVTDKYCEIDWRIQEGLTTVGDKHLLALMLNNLLGNANKFTSKKTHARIEFGGTIDEEGDSPIYFVRDNGAGFDMQFADNLFQPFHRMHDNTVFEGTGVGLATVQRVIHRHGGRIWAEAEPDKGATFYFTLPGAKQTSHPSS